MNKIKILVTMALVSVGLASYAANGSLTDTGYSVYATAGTALNLGTNYVIIPPNSITGGEPLITYINYTTFNGTGAAATLQSYVSTNQTTALGTNNTTTLWVASTNGFVAGQPVVIQHLTMPFKRFANEAAIIDSVALTNLVLKTAPTTVLQAGDIVNQETAWASIPVGNLTSTTASINGSGILSGQRNEPFLIVASTSGSGTNAINAINAVFQP